MQRFFKNTSHHYDNTPIPVWNLQNMIPIWYVHNMIRVLHTSPNELFPPIFCAWVSFIAPVTCLLCCPELKPAINVGSTSSIQRLYGCTKRTVFWADWSPTGHRPCYMSIMAFKQFVIRLMWRSFSTPNLFSFVLIIREEKGILTALNFNWIKLEPLKPATKLEPQLELLLRSFILPS
jgi:hypothetical protein